MSRESLLGTHGYAYSKLSDKEKMLYEDLYGMIKSRSSIEIGSMNSVDAQNAKRALTCIDMDHPELFWMDDYRNALASGVKILFGNKISTSKAISDFFDAQDMDGDGAITLSERIDAFEQPILDVDPLTKWDYGNRLTLSPLLTNGRISSMQTVIEEATTPFYQHVKSNLDDFDVLKQALEFLAVNTEQSHRISGRARDVRSVFLEGESSSAGYSEALQYLLLLCGIPCFSVRGIAVHPRTEVYVPHSWNYVLIEGEWNIVDPMWGDWDSVVGASHYPDEKILKTVPFNYAYMCLTGADRSSVEVVPLPKPSNTSDYFIHENRDLSDLTIDSIMDALFSLFSDPKRAIVVRCRKQEDEMIDFLRKAVPACLFLFAISDGDVRRLAETKNRSIELARRTGMEKVQAKGLEHLLDVHVSPLGETLYGLTLGTD